MCLTKQLFKIRFYRDLRLLSCLKTSLFPVSLYFARPMSTLHLEQIMPTELAASDSLYSAQLMRQKCRCVWGFSICFTLTRTRTLRALIGI